MSDELALITPATQNKYLYFFFYFAFKLSSVGSAESKNVYKDNNTVLIFSLCISPADIIIILLLSKVASKIYTHYIYCVCLPRSRSSHFFSYARTLWFFFFFFFSKCSTNWLAFLVYRFSYF